MCYLGKLELDEWPNSTLRESCVVWMQANGKDFMKACKCSSGVDNSRK